MRLALLAHALAVCSALQLQPSRPVLHASCAPRTNGVFAGRKGRPSGQQLGMQGQQMGGPKGPPEDGSSLFYLYCRAERKDLWYPVSVLQSDSQAPTPPTAHPPPPAAHRPHGSPPTPPTPLTADTGQAQGLINAWLNAPIAKGVFKVFTSG